MSIRSSTLYKIRGKNTWEQINKSKTFSSDFIWIKSFYDQSHANEPVKLGFAISKKYGNAVKRNRFKRRVRETLRIFQKENNSFNGWVFLVGVTKNFENEVSYNQIQNAFSAFVLRLK
ncbi:MAG: ribonuclease P protein component [Acidimicrobiia bacterium]